MYRAVHKLHRLLVAKVHRAYVKYAKPYLHAADAKVRGCATSMRTLGVATTAFFLVEPARWLLATGLHSWVYEKLASAAGRSVGILSIAIAGLVSYARHICESAVSRAGKLTSV